MQEWWEKKKVKNDVNGENEQKFTQKCLTPLNIMTPLNITAAKKKRLSHRVERWDNRMLISSRNFGAPKELRSHGERKNNAALYFDSSKSVSEVDSDAESAFADSDSAFAESCDFLSEPKRAANA